MKHLFHTSFALIALLLIPTLTSCDLINEDLEPCETQVTLSFVDDYNMNRADAFANEVESVAVWAFDQDGKCVWSKTDSGDALSRPGYSLGVDLPDGTYDFIAWCGKEGNSDFSLAASDITSKDDLRLMLEAENARAVLPDADVVSKKDLKTIFHGKLDAVTIKHDPSSPKSIDLRMRLVKDTHTVRVALHNVDGRVMDPKDFAVYITAENSILNFDNEWMKCPVVRYADWNIRPIEAVIPDGNGGSIVTSNTAIQAELTTSRLFREKGATLTIKNLKDDRIVFSLELTHYLTQGRGTAHQNMPEQEFLDRNAEYNLIFFLDNNNNWYLPLGIYVNDWHVVPDQISEF